MEATTEPEALVLLALTTARDRCCIMLLAGAAKASCKWVSAVLQRLLARAANGHQRCYKPSATVLQTMLDGAANGHQWRCKPSTAVLQMGFGGAAEAARRSCKPSGHGHRRCCKPSAAMLQMFCCPATLVFFFCYNVFGEVSGEVFSDSPVKSLAGLRRCFQRGLR
jgi:hypothetical protein